MRSQPWTYSKFENPRRNVLSLNLALIYLLAACCYSMLQVESVVQGIIVLASSSFV